MPEILGILTLWTSGLSRSRHCPSAFALLTLEGAVDSRAVLAQAVNLEAGRGAQAGLGLLFSTAPL